TQFRRRRSIMVETAQALASGGDMADTTFPRMSGWKNGYDANQVDSFFKLARESFELPTPQPGYLDSRAVRTVGFDLVRKGYHVAVVDAALDRLEDAFAKQARDRLIAQSGQDAWVAELIRVATSLLGRLVRVALVRFDHLPTF